MNRKKEMIIALVGIFVLIFLMFGVTYAVFTYTKFGSTENIITTGALRFLYTENSTGISITNAKPVADSVGMAYTSDETVFDFKLEGTNTSDENFYYKITLEKDSSSTLDESAVKVYLTDVDSGDTKLKGPNLYKDLDEYNEADNVREAFLYQESVTNDYSKNFRLRMWVSDSIDFKSGNYDSQTFASTVNVYFDTTKVDSMANTLKNRILENSIVDATPTLTDSSNNTSDASGLYKSTETNDGSPTYYFRGNIENNYVSFAGFTWRIVRINEDGTIRLIMQDGINNNTTYVFQGTTDNAVYMYYNNSNIKNYLNSWYTTNIKNKGYSDKVSTGNYFCQQAKVKPNSSWEYGEVYTSYTPNFKCTSPINSNIGTITYDEIVHAGGYYGKTNDNYYLHNNARTWWTMSPSGVDTSSIPRVWSFDKLSSYGVDNSYGVRAMINLNADVIVTGSGLSDDMYIVQ